MESNRISNPSTPQHDAPPEDSQIPEGPLDCSLKKPPETGNQYHLQFMPVGIESQDRVLPREDSRRNDRSGQKEDLKTKSFQSPPALLRPPSVSSPPIYLDDPSYINPKNKRRPQRQHEKIEEVLVKPISLPPSVVAEGLHHTFVPAIYPRPIDLRSALEEMWPLMQQVPSQTYDGLLAVEGLPLLRARSREAYKPLTDLLHSPITGPMGASFPRIPERPSHSLSPTCLSSPEPNSLTLDAQFPEQASSGDVRVPLLRQESSSPGRVSSSCSAPKRKKGQPVPDSMKMTDDYRQKRDKNNEAAKRSRDKRRTNEKMLVEKVNALQKANEGYHSNWQRIMGFHRLQQDLLFKKIEALELEKKESENLIQELRAKIINAEASFKNILENVRNCRSCSSKVPLNPICPKANLFSR